MAALLRGVAFIPGAASGIGQHTALSFAKHGMKALALADINGEALAKSAAALREKCADVKTVELQFDVRDSTSIKSKLTEAVEELGGRLDVAVNNAGIGGGGKPTPEASEEEWLRIIDKIAIMLKQEHLGPRIGRGVIINVAPGTTIAQSAYAAAKYGVVGLSKRDGNTFGQHGIRVNAICPGYVETPLLRGSMETTTDSPLGDSIIMMASPLASFMNSAAIVVDSEFTAQ
ncbi:3-oxoacyl-reductase [Xylariaceae sp. FL0255]|nr:3-oxoacyl-reductase [Xylariaceae sp. FL0255]